MFITWLATKLGVSAFVAKLVTASVIALVLFVSLQMYVNKAVDKAKAETRAAMGGEVAKQVEIQVKEQRAALTIKENNLEQQRAKIVQDATSLAQARADEARARVQELNAVKELERLRYAQISTYVRNIPSDQLDDAIRSFIAKYSEQTVK